MTAAKFRTQLVAGWLASLVLVVGMTVTAIVALHVTAASEGALARDLGDDLTAVQRLRLDAEQVIGATRGYLLTGGEPGYTAKLAAARADFDAQLQRATDDGDDPDARRDVATVERAARAYTLAAQQVAEAKAMVASFDETLQPKRATLEASVAAFAHHRRELLDAALAHAESHARAAQLVLLAAAIATIALALLLAIAVIRTVTAQFRRAELAQATAQAEAAARQELLAIVSHDLRNPLGAIVLGASALELGCTDAMSRRQVQVVHNAATRMQHMIDELLEAAQLDAGNLALHATPCDARSLLADTVELFQARAAAQRIDLRSVADDTIVVGDRERLLEVLANLIGNALKFTPAGGQITVRGERCDRGVHFTVADTGPGIAPDQLPHLFDRYWQAARGTSRTGLGLGLYICKRLVDAHHGAIGVDSTLGAGTTFWFDVPADATPPAYNRA